MPRGIYKKTEEHKRKISEWMKGNKNSLGRTCYWKGKHLSDETKEKIRLGNSGKIVSDVTRIKMSKAHVGHQHSPSGENHYKWKGGVVKNKGYQWAHGGRAYELRRKNVLGTHSIADWEALKKKYRYMCLCCKRTEPEIILTRDHIIPLKLGGTDYISNIQPLCGSCNSRKNAKTIDFISNFFQLNERTN